MEKEPKKVKNPYIGVDYQEKYFNSLKEIDHLQFKITYCTFKMYWNGLKNRIARKNFAIIHKGSRSWYKSFHLNGTHYMFIKDFDGTDTYFYKEFKNVIGEDFIKYYYIKKNGKLHFGTEVVRDYGDRRSC